MWLLFYFKLGCVKEVICILSFLNSFFFLLFWFWFGEGVALSRQLALSKSKPKELDQGLDQGLVLLVGPLIMLQSGSFC